MEIKEETFSSEGKMTPQEKLKMADELASTFTSFMVDAFKRDDVPIDIAISAALESTAYILTVAVTQLCKSKETYAEGQNIIDQCRQTWSAYLDSLQQRINESKEDN